MQITVLAEDYPPNQGGIADYAGNLVKALENHGHDVRVVAPHVTGDEITDKLSSTAVRRVGELDVRRKKLNIFKRIKSVKRMTAEVDAWLDDVFDGAKPDFAIITSVSVWAHTCFKRGIPYVVCVHGGDAFGKRSDILRTLYRKRVVRQILKNALRVAANSDFTRDLIIENGVMPENIVITYCGVDTKFLTAVDNSGTKMLEKGFQGQLLMMCRLVKFKACDIVIMAFNELVKKHSEMTLKIVGDGPERTVLEKMVVDLGLEHKIEFLGYVNDIDNKARLFKEADLFVLSGRFDPVTGRQETFGIVFAEAGASMRPVIGPRIGGIPYSIQDRETGFLVEPDDVKTMIDAIERFYNDTELASRMGRAGRTRVEEEFNYDAIASKLLNSLS